MCIKKVDDVTIRTVEEINENIAKAGDTGTSQDLVTDNSNPIKYEVTQHIHKLQGT